MSDRQRYTAKIHILKKELALSDSAYRAVLKNFGVNSSSELDEEGLLQLAATMSGMAKAPAKTRTKTPQERKIWALWFELQKYLSPEKCTPKYLAGMVAHIAPLPCDSGVLRFDRLDGKAMHKVIEALKQRLDYEADLIHSEVPF